MERTRAAHPSGVQWRSTTVRRIFRAPRICGLAIYRGEILTDEQGKTVRGRWEPILTEQEYDAVVAAWKSYRPGRRHRSWPSYSSESRSPPRHYEAGQYSPTRYFLSLARMEAQEAELLREKRRYEQRQQTRQHAVANLAQEWDKPDFTMEQKQAAIAQSLAAIIIKPAGKGRRFHPDQIVPVFNDDTRPA